MSQITRKVESDYTSTGVVAAASTDNESALDNFSDKIQNIVHRSLLSMESAAAVGAKEIPTELNEGALALKQKEENSKSVTIDLSKNTTSFYPHEGYPTGYWYSEEEGASFKEECLKEFSDFQNQNLPREFENSEAVLRRNAQMFKHRLNFPSSYLEESPARLDLKRFESVKTVLKDPSREIPLIVYRSIEEHLKKEIAR